jgi:hypothetical protein
MDDVKIIYQEELFERKAIIDGKEFIVYAEEDSRMSDWFDVYIFNGNDSEYYCSTNDPESSISNVIHRLIAKSI